MSDSEFKSDERFKEQDDQETQLGYGEGRVPFYIAILWVGFIISYVVVMSILALPDFQAWSSR